MMQADTATEFILLMPDALHAFLAVWIFCVGACVGSFLNVVVLRVPASINITTTGSRCPVCLHAIRWYDNIPLLSWLVLRGRCRDCKTWISARYPLSELLIACLFLGLALGETFRDGQNLPAVGEAAEYYYRTVEQMWVLFAFHALLLATLLAAAMISADRHPIPIQLFLPALLVGLTIPWLLPYVNVVAAWPDSELSARPAGGMATAGGAVVGGLVGWLTGTVFSPAHNPSQLNLQRGPTVAVGAAIVGIYLGWQAVLVISLVATAGHFLERLSRTRWPRLPMIGWFGWLSLTAFALILGWRNLAQHLPQFSVEMHGATGVAVILATVAVAWATSRVRIVTRTSTHTPTAKGTIMESEDQARNLEKILQSPSYLLPEKDVDLMSQPELRPIRVQLELLKSELTFAKEGIDSTIVVFGGTQIFERELAEDKLARAEAGLREQPNDSARKRLVDRARRVLDKSHYYDAARRFGQLVSSQCQTDGKCDYVIMTGGGPGIMEAANRGAFSVGAKSIGLNITLPDEQQPNPYITPELCFQFHYFALRKMHFLMRARALVVFPGGFGTLDELFDALTLRQTERMQQIPIVLFGRDYWTRVIDFQFLADEGVISDDHLSLCSFAETPEEAWQTIVDYHATTGEEH